MSAGLERLIPAASYLEDAFLRWVLTPAVDASIVARIRSQHPVTVNERAYRLDYLIAGEALQLAVELDGFAFHSDRAAFTYDRLRQNDLAATGLTILRFSYDAVRTDTARCVAQLQAMLRQDPLLAPLVTAVPRIGIPDMAGDPMRAADPPGGAELPSGGAYFAGERARVDRAPLRECQDEALASLANYYASGGRHAAAVMAVGSGKTALGVAAALSFSRRRALVVTPGSVIRGTFAKALDPGIPGNVLYGLAGGPLLPGARPPATLVLDADDGQISQVSRERPPHRPPPEQRAPVLAAMAASPDGAVLATRTLHRATTPDNNDSEEVQTAEDWSLQARDAVTEQIAQHLVPTADRPAEELTESDTDMIWMWRHTHPDSLRPWLRQRLDNGWEPLTLLGKLLQPAPRPHRLIDESVLAGLDAMFGLDDLYTRLDPLLQTQTSNSADEHHANILQALREHRPTTGQTPPPNSGTTA